MHDSWSAFGIQGFLRIRSCVSKVIYNGIASQNSSWTSIPVLLRQTEAPSNPSPQWSLMGYWDWGTCNEIVGRFQCKCQFILNVYRKETGRCAKTVFTRNLKLV